MKHELLRVQQGIIYHDQELILNDLYLQVFEGELLVVYCGRTQEREQLCRFFTGEETLSGGQIFFSGERIREKEITGILRDHVGLISAESRLIEIFTLAENLFVSRMPALSNLRYKKMFERANHLFEEFDLQLSAQMRIIDLSPLELMQVELLKAYTENRRLIVIDNMTNFLSLNEQEEIFRLMKMICKKGFSFVVLDNYEPSIIDYADQITLISNGKTQYCFAKNQLNEAILYRILVGSKDQSTFGAAARSEKGTAINIQHLAGRTIKDVTFTIRIGETVHLIYDRIQEVSELFAILQGEAKAQSGEMFLLGRKYRPQDLSDAIERGVGFITRQPVCEQLFPDMDLFDNLCITKSRMRDWPIWVCRRYRRHISQLCEEYLGIDRSDRFLITLRAEDLIRVLYLKWLIRHPILLVCAHPFASADIKSRLAAEEMIHSISERGIAVLLISPADKTLHPFGGRTIYLKNGYIQEQELSGTGDFHRDQPEKGPTKEGF